MLINLMGLDSLSAPRSSYIKTFNKKLAQKNGAVIPIDNTQMGNVLLSWQYEESTRLYRCTWKSRLSNSVTVINRLGIDKYLVSRTSPRMSQPMSYVFNDKEPAIQAFFCNLDLFRITDDLAKDARSWCGDHIKRAEGLKSIYFNPKKTKKQQTSFNKTILIGNNKQHQGILVGIDFTGKKVRVRVEDPNTGKLGPEKTITADLAWLE